MVRLPIAQLRDWTMSRRLTIIEFAKPHFPPVSIPASTFMTSQFDPYRDWLGIQYSGSRPNPWELLGLPPYESDPRAVNDAVQRRLQIVHLHLEGPDGSVAQRLLLEIGRARNVLLDPDQRGRVEKALREEQNSPAKAVDPSPGQPSSNRGSEAPTISITPTSSSDAGRAAMRPRPIRKKRSSFGIELVGWVAGAIMALGFGYFLLESGWLNSSSESETNSREPAATATNDERNPAEDLASSPLTAEIDSVERRDQSTLLGHSSGSPSSANTTTADPDDTGRSSTPAPWSMDARLPAMPPEWEKTPSRSAARIKPFWIAVSQREYQAARQFWPKVAVFGAQMKPPIQGQRTLDELQAFWSSVGEQLARLKRGVQLKWGEYQVAVAAVSDRSIELEWTDPETGTRSTKRFSTTQKEIDRDLAVAMARAAGESPARIELFLKHDFRHLDLPLPPEVAVGSNLTVNRDGPGQTLTRKPIPSAKDIEPHRIAVMELYGVDFKSEDFVAQRKTGRKILRDVASANESVQAYAMLDIVRTIGQQIGDGRLMADAILNMEGRFDVDVVDELVDALNQIRRSAKTDYQKSTVLELLAELLPRAARAERFTDYREATGRGIAFFRSMKLRKQREMLESSRRVAEECEALAASVVGVDLRQPPESIEPQNQAIAEYLCFVRRDWPTGLPWLASCPDDALHSAAQEELVRDPQDVKATLNLANRWYELANEAQGVRQVGLMAHAWELYDSIRDETSGLDRVLVDRRLIDTRPYVDHFALYVHDDGFFRSHQWQFMHNDQVVFSKAQFINQIFRYQLAGKTRSLPVVKQGFARTIHPQEATEVQLRMMRDRTIELLQFDLSNGDLIAVGEGKPVEP